MADKEMMVVIDQRVPVLVTDEMCKRAIIAMAPDRIQGFSTQLSGIGKWGAPHWIRDVWRQAHEQEIWRGDSEVEFHERCQIERMRLAITAALTEPDNAP